MVRFYVVLLLGLQPVVGQFCGIQASCSSCVSLPGCVWNFNLCLSSTAVLSCISPGCIGYLGICPALTSPVVYATTPPLPAPLPLYPPPISSAPVYASTPLYASGSLSLPPLYASGSVALPPLYAKPSVIPPVIGPPLYSTSVSAPVIGQLAETYTAPLTTPLYSPPVTTTPLYSPTVATTPLYSSSVATSVAAPLYAGASFAAPIYSSAVVPPVRAGFSAGLYGGPFVNNRILPGPLFDSRGNPVDNIIHNNFIANGLAPLIPGIGGVVGVANDLNVIQNSPRFIDNLFDGRGYQRDPLGNFVRNNFFADQLGRFVPGVSGSLQAYNKLNLYTSLLG